MSLKVVLFKSLGAVSYSTSIVTMTVNYVSGAACGCRVVISSAKFRQYTSFACIFAHEFCQCSKPYESRTL